jgi:uncharacterized protein (TIRG00374 family)
LHIALGSTWLKTGKKVIFIVKVTITLILSALIVWKVDWQETLRALGETNIIILGLVFAGMVLNVFSSALKWKIILSIHGISFPFNQLYKYYFTSSFFNNFLLSTIGGDAYRIYKTYKNPVSKTGAFAAVLVERITGIIALLLLGYLGAIIGYIRTDNDISRIVTFGGTLGIFVFMVSILTLIFMGGSIKQFFVKIVPQKYHRLGDILQDYRRNYRKTAMITLLSLSFQFFLVIYRMLLIYAVGATISVADLAVVIALSTVVALAPISINGLGLLDGSYIYLLTQFNVGYEQAFVVMILIRLLTFTLSLIGGIFYLFDRRSLQIEDFNVGELKNTYS